MNKKWYAEYISILFVILVVKYLSHFFYCCFSRIWQPGLHGLGTAQQAGIYYNFDHSTYFITLDAFIRVVIIST